MANRKRNLSLSECRRRCFNKRSYRLSIKGGSIKDVAAGCAAHCLNLLLKNCFLLKLHMKNKSLCDAKRKNKKDKKEGEEGGGGGRRSSLGKNKKGLEVTSPTGLQVTSPGWSLSEGPHAGGPKTRADGAQATMKCVWLGDMD